MSIRIRNNNNGRIIIIKNQDDMNNLDRRLSSIDSNKRELDMFSDEDHYSPYANSAERFDVASPSSDLKNRLSYNSNKGFNDQFDFDSFDDDDEDHYIEISAYPLDTEEASWNDPSVVDEPINKLKEPTIPDDQTDDDFEFDDFEDFEEDEQDGLKPDDVDADFDADEEENPDFQGMIRTVKGACLVFKRKTEDGTYDELWIYNVGNDLSAETSIRKSILSGTDIDPNTHRSDDGTQKASTWSVGNVQYLKLSGLPQ